MRGHQHLGDPGLTQNQGNLLGDRPCVRQSRLYREHVGGNTMKELMGQEGLKWDTTCTQGVYAGGKVFDHNDKPRTQVVAEDASSSNKSDIDLGNATGTDAEVVIAMETEDDRTSATQAPTQAPAQPPQDQQRQSVTGAVPVAGRAFRPGAGYANRQTYNLFTGE
ncbi:hypothetical protein TraAM80_01806 [Trypanosoma rangeli]|uniref:Uncharacterized protein n=1 Tax=Trypanosoma rangeli TaxID=5698 RepID=A0A422NWW8_TRYRA|nr:uncharacterized protein TraAM80_01806 [Trypanosoma rangeli]RNF09967.1 hypothetical protein TraAM80_01806 [Trypanosoma rangeli]|eukprot:RNF09967.1 hypothetical protein TraAM80_01806 [Trypanosoma rangeli]